MMTLYVRQRHFDRDVGTYYWNESNHSWGCLATANVYTKTEVASMTLHPENEQPDHATYFRESTKSDQYVPGEGEWAPLPDWLKIKTVDEYLADAR
jgi:hypothetical protein